MESEKNTNLYKLKETKETIFFSLKLEKDMGNTN